MDRITRDLMAIFSLVSATFVSFCVPYVIPSHVVSSRRSLERSLMMSLPSLDRIYSVRCKIPCSREGRWTLMDSHPWRTRLLWGVYIPLETFPLMWAPKGCYRDWKLCAPGTELRAILLCASLSIVPSMTRYRAHLHHIYDFINDCTMERAYVFLEGLRHDVVGSTVGLLIAASHG